jgi:ribonuclease HI
MQQELVPTSNRYQTLCDSDLEPDPNWDSAMAAASTPPGDDPSVHAKPPDRMYTLGGIVTITNPAATFVVPSALVPFNDVHLANRKRKHRILEGDMVYGFSDGGCLDSGSMAAGWWLAHEDTLLGGSGSLIHNDIPSNNVAEYTGLIHCLEAALDKNVDHLSMNMDSLLVVSQIRGDWACRSDALRPLYVYARSLADQFSSFQIFHVYREMNTTADALCNRAFEGMVLSNPKSGWTRYIRANLPWIAELHHAQRNQPGATDSDMWKQCWGLVMTELQQYGPMIRNSWHPPAPVFPTDYDVDIGEITVIDPPPPLATLGPLWPFVIHPSALQELKKIAIEGGVPWNRDRFRTLEPTINEYGIAVFPYPVKDAEFTTRLLCGINWNLPRLIQAWRGETSIDSRPNKSLDMERISSATAGYADRDALSALINTGYRLHWATDFQGARPLPRNHPSAEENHEIMGATILKNYQNGRLMVMEAAAVGRNVRKFATSPFGCVPKAHKPLTTACRPIHDQSSPGKKSVNANLDPTQRPDAKWPGAGALANRVVDAARLYGAANLFGFVVDIKDAFHNVGLAATDAVVNGGILPRSDIATLATTCIFGNGESPGAFKILNCVTHVHTQNGSLIHGENVPFDARFYVDDGNIIEPWIGDRLLASETSLRRSIDLVFGPNSIQENKTAPWSRIFTSLGFEWDLYRGLVSIPAEKLARVQRVVADFARLSSAPVSSFRSVVGKLRHVATCCKPAASLMQLLGGGLGTSREGYGKRIRKITPAMRKELQWWANELVPERFHHLPVEWLGSSPKRVDRWLHIYSLEEIGVWIVDHQAHQVVYHPWLGSLEETLLASIILCLSYEPHSARMLHTCFIVNECSVAIILNRCNSATSSLQHYLRTLGLWQLQLRHRISATTPRWENLPDLNYSPCMNHDSPLTKLFLQISSNTPLGVNSPWPSRHGKWPPSQPAPTALIPGTFNIGCTSASPSTSPKFGWMTCLLATKASSWLGTRLSVENMATTRTVLEISMLPTRLKSKPSSGLTNITAMLNSLYEGPPSTWSSHPIVGTKTSPARNSPFLPICCSWCTANWPRGKPTTDNWPGDALFCSTSISVAPVSSGLHLPPPRQSTTEQKETNTVDLGPSNVEQSTRTCKPNSIIGSKRKTASYETKLEQPFRVRKKTGYTRLPLHFDMPRPTRPEDPTRSHLADLDIRSSARSRGQSSLYRPARNGNSPTRPARSLAALRGSRSSASSRQQLSPLAKTQPTLHSTQSASVTPQPSSKRASTNLPSASPADGQAMSWDSTPESLARSC